MQGARQRKKRAHTHNNIGFDKINAVFIYANHPIQMSIRCCCCCSFVSLLVFFVFLVSTLSMCYFSLALFLALVSSLSHSILLPSVTVYLSACISIRKCSYVRVLYKYIVLLIVTFPCRPPYTINLLWLLLITPCCRQIESIWHGSINANILITN